MREFPYKPHLHMLAVIADHDKAGRITELYKGARVHFQYHCRASGTANSEILDLLGLGNSEKVVVLCFSTAQSIEKLLYAVSAELNLKRRGNGIAFTIPLSGVSNPVIKRLDPEIRDTVNKHIEREVDIMKNEVTHELILAVINQGYSEDVMEAAKKAGATGGTVIPARRAGVEDTMKFLGISIQEEKEIVAIIASRELKLDIMTAISHDCGVKTDARGVVLSMPVNTIAGLGEEV